MPRGIEFEPDPIAYLEALAETDRVRFWRFAVDRHYSYQAMDQSGATREREGEGVLRSQA